MWRSRSRSRPIFITQASREALEYGSKHSYSPLHENKEQNMTIYLARVDEMAEKGIAHVDSVIMGKPLSSRENLEKKLRKMGYTPSAELNGVYLWVSNKGEARVFSITI